MIRPAPLRRLLGLALTLALSLAMPGAATAHLLAGGAPEREALALYVAMGGKLGDLCGAGDLAGLARCDACHPAGAAVPPSPAPAAQARVGRARRAAPPRRRPSAPSRNGAAPARGPPPRRGVGSSSKTGPIPYGTSEDHRE
jgi:hypothetical protein